MIPPYKGGVVNKQVEIETGNSPEYMLFNINNDVSQQHNLVKENPQNIKRID